MLSGRFALSTVAATGVAAGTIALGAPAAVAQSACQKATGGSTSSISYTGKNSGNSKSGYTCAYQGSSGKKSLKPWQTKSWTSNTASGYYKITSCSSSEKNVTVSPAYATTVFGSSYTQTATNWDVSKTRHWGGGVLWATDTVKGSQYSTGNCNWGDFPVSLYWTTNLSLTLVSVSRTTGAVSFTATATPDGNAPAQGQVGLFRQVGATQDPQIKDSSGNVVSGTDPVVAGGSLADGQITLTTPPLPSGEYQFYAAYPGTSVDLAPPQRGWTAAFSATIPISITQGTSTSVAATPAETVASGIGPAGVSVVNAQAEQPARLQARCPSGSLALNAEVGSPTAALDSGDLAWSRRGAALDAPGLRRGTDVALQVVCREIGERPATVGSMAWGTEKSDKMRVGKGQTTLTGLSGDRVELRGKRSAAFTSLGADRIEIRAARAVASAGPGRDTIISRTKNPATATGNAAGGSMIIPGPGKDYVVAGNGPDRVNLRDGEPGDRVECRTKRTKVLADPGDIIVGPCRVIG